jgi:hypothetical protein
VRFDELLDFPLFERLPEVRVEVPLDLEFELFVFERELITGVFERLGLLFSVDVFVLGVLLVFVLTLSVDVYGVSQFQIDLFFFADGLSLVVFTSVFTSSVRFVLSRPPV